MINDAGKHEVKNRRLIPHLIPLAGDAFARAARAKFLPHRGGLAHVGFAFVTESGA
jgi:hypothetical protein